MPRTIPARERILKAAFELISRHGYRGTSTREIAQKAHVAEVTLFRHFSNKETLFGEVLRSFSSIPALAELLPLLKRLPYEEALETLVRCFMERLEANRDWIRILNYEIDFAPKTMRGVYAAFLDRLFDVFTEFFRDAQQRGTVRKDLAPEYLARALHSQCFGFSCIERELSITSGETPERGEMLGAFVKIFCRGTQCP